MKELRLIFDNEIKFLQEQLGVEIPSESAWMDRMCIKVVDKDNNWRIIYRIKAEAMNLELKKDNRELLKEIKSMGCKLF